MNDIHRVRKDLLNRRAAKRPAAGTDGQGGESKRSRRGTSPDLENIIFEHPDTACG